MTVKVSYLRGHIEGESAFLGEAKISPEADAVSIVASQQAWDVLETDLRDVVVSKLSLVSVNERNIDVDGSKISLKSEDGSTAIPEYVFENPLSFQAFNLLVTGQVSKTEIHRALKSKDKQTGWKWSGNAK